MVAKAFTVSRSGVKREVPSPKRKSARERLLDHVRPNREAIPPEDDPKFMPTVLRLLRAHERELAERAAAVGANAASARDHRAVYDAIRAAILKRSATPKAVGPAVTRKRGTR